MAGVFFNGSSGAVSLVANAQKTVLQVRETAVRAKICGIRVFGTSPAGGADAPVSVFFSRSTSNFGTGTSVTPVKKDTTDTETPQFTLFSNFTVEPTSPASSVLMYTINPQTGLIENFTPEQQWQIPNGTALNISILAPTACSVVVDVDIEE